MKASLFGAIKFLYQGHCEILPGAQRGAGTVRSVVVCGAILSAVAAHAETIRCSTSFQGYGVCTGADGYRSFEFENGGRLYGDDSQGNRWMTTPGPYGDTTIIRRRGE
jgi:hypothetical protein